VVESGGSSVGFFNIIIIINVLLVALEPLFRDQLLVQIVVLDEEGRG
jgi:hypothetical protein